MDSEKLLQQAIEAVRQGADPDEVNKRIADLSDYPNLFALQMAVESAAEFVAAEELEDIGEHPIRNFLGAMGQGVTFGFLDEIVGAADEGAGERMRQAQELRREHAPGATAMGEIAGSLLLPAIPALGASKAAPGLAKGAMTGAARGGLFGALGGAAAGAGFAEEGRRAEGARTGALAGGAAGTALGVPMGALGGLFGAAAGRGARVAKKMLGLANVDEASLLASKGRVAMEKAHIQETLYRPLQEAHEAVTDPGVMAWLQNTSTNQNLRAVIPRQFRAGTQRVRSGPGRATGQLVRGSEMPPSFQDLQDIRNGLRKRAYDRAGDVSDREALAAMEELTEVMEDTFGPDLAVADAAWARASSNERSLEKGWRDFNKPAEKIDEVRANLTPEQLDYFDEGRLARITAELGVRNRSAVGLLQQYLDAGPDTRRRLASLFPGEENGTAFQTLERMLKHERKTAAIADFFNSTIKSGAIGATGGAITGGLMSRGRGGQPGG
jgi:hypothetical protein